MKKLRKGFTLVELLIVIAILGALSAGMSVSSSKATAAAKATTINNNINAIKTAAALYQLQEGNEFKESKVDASELKKANILNLDIYNKGKDGTTASVIQYTITKGADAGAGAYVVCNFAKDKDSVEIAKILRGYKNLRFDKEYDANEETATAVGSFLYHDTLSDQDTDLAYDCAFTYTVTP